MYVALARPARAPTGARAGVLVALAIAAVSCAADPNEPSMRSPWSKVQRLLAIDFAPAATQKSSTSLDHVLAAPWAELQRTNHLLADLEAAADEPGHRIERLPDKVTGAWHREYQRLTHFWQNLPAPPPANRVAKTIAADLERVGLLLGFERRPLREISDPEHRTDPDDLRPPVSWWQRLRRRILP